MFFGDVLRPKTSSDRFQGERLALHGAHVPVSIDCVRGVAGCGRIERILSRPAWGLRNDYASVCAVG